MKRLNHFASFLALIILIMSGAGCTKDVTKLTITGPDQGSVGESITLLANKDDVTWHSSDEALATIDQNGVCILISTGTVTITATTATDSCDHVIEITRSATLVIAGESSIEVGTVTTLSVLGASDLNWVSSNEAIATISKDGLVRALAIGTTTITATATNGEYGMFMLTVTPSSASFTITGPTEVYSGRTWSYQAKGEVATSWTTSNTVDCTISNDGVLTVYSEKAFNVTISATSANGEVASLYVEVLDKVPTYDHSLFYVDSSLEEAKLRDPITHDGVIYYYGYNAFYTIASCLNNVTEGATIYVAGGEYDLSDNAGDLNIKVNNLTFLGPNAGKLPTDTREHEALIYQNVNLYSAVQGTTFDGFQFFGSTYINFVGLNANTTITSCVFNKGYGSSSIKEGLNYPKGTIRFNYTTTSVTDGLTITNNTFSNLKDVCITLGNAINVTIAGNTFTNIATHAIYANPFSYNNEHLVKITGNTFTNITGSAYKTAAWGLASSNEKDLLLMQSNTFERVGTDGKSPLLDIAKYEDGAAALSFIGNEVSKTDRIIDASFTLDENDVDVVIVMNYNCFLGEPNDYYVSSHLASALSAMYNFYADESGTALVSSTSLTAKGADTANAVTKEVAKNAPVLAVTPMALMGEDDITIAGADSITALTMDIASLNGSKVNLKSVGLARFSVTKGNKTGYFLLYVREYLGTDYIKAFVELALSQEGYVEGDNNYTKYGAWYGIPNGAWCAMFVAWCANHSGIPRTIIPSYALVRNYESWYRDAGRFGEKGSYKPTCGDLIIFTSNGASHIGIVTYCDGSTVYTIEGNTSNMCAERRYSLSNARITGYGRPNYPEYLGKPYVYYPDGVKPDEDHSTT